MLKFPYTLFFENVLKVTVDTFSGMDDVNVPESTFVVCCRLTKGYSFHGLLYERAPTERANQAAAGGCTAVG